MVGGYLVAVPDALVGRRNDRCALTVAVGSTDLGKTFCSIVAAGARSWPWPTGLNLLPGPSSTFAFEADGPLFGRGVLRLDWVELITTEKPRSLVSVMGPKPEQPEGTILVCADDFFLTLNEGWQETDEDECWLKLPEEAAAPGVPPVVDERAEVLVLTTTMGRAWLQLPLSSGRGRLRDAPSVPWWSPFGRLRG